MMRQLRAWAVRVGGIFTRARRQREFDEELQSHLEMHVEDNIRSGMTPERARREALIALGGTVPIREAYRDRLGLPILDTLLQDVRFGWRMLRRTPGVSASAIIAIALGIGVNTMVFSLANAVLYKRLPGVDADRLVFIGRLTVDGDDNEGLARKDFEELRRRVTSVTRLAAAASTAADLRDADGYAEALQGEEVTRDAFAALGLRVLAGREFVASDAVGGAPAVAILSADVWERRYSRDPAVIGRTVTLNGAPATVVGVVDTAPLISDGHTGVWTPLRDDRVGVDRLLVFGRLAQGATVDSANAEVRAIGGLLARESSANDQPMPLVAGDFRSFSLPARVRVLFLVMLGAVGFVLLVACANVANLLLARASDRVREITIRTAIGATRRRIVRQLLIESLILAAAGAAIGLCIAVWGVGVFDRALVDTGRPLWLDFSIDVRVLGYLTIVTFATAVLFGLAPAWRLSRLDMVSAMKEGTSGSGRFSGRRVMSALVVAELALAVVLLAGAGIMIRSFLNIYQVPLGFERKDLHTFRLNTAWYYESARDRARLFTDLVARLESVAGVSAAAVASQLPATNVSIDLPIQLDEAASGPQQVSVASAIGSYDRALGVRITDGRFLTVAESTGAPTAAVVNEAFAARAWPGQRPVGRQLRFVIGGRPQPWLTVVGVMADIAQRERQLHRPYVYVPYLLRPETDIGVIVRSEIPPHELFPEIRSAVAAANPNLPVLELNTFDDQFHLEHWPARVFGALFGAFGAIALVLAVVGLYGVTSYSASRRRHEIGVRVALGARPRDVLAHVVSGSLRQTAVALVLGLAGAAALTRLLSAQLVDVSPQDPGTFAGVVLVLSLTAIAGCTVPVRRALRVNPVEVLRHE